MQVQEVRKWAVERAQSHGPRDSGGRHPTAEVTLAYAKKLEAYVLGEPSPGR